MASVVTGTHRTPPPMSLPSLLGRWHHWRRAYSHERGYSRPWSPDADPDPDDELEALLMRTVDEEVSRLSPEHQRAIQQLARVEAVGSNYVNPVDTELLISEALDILDKRLTRAGIL